MKKVALALPGKGRYTGRKKNNLQLQAGTALAYSFTVRTKQDLISAVEEFGIVPYFSTSIPGFSLEEHCSPSVLFSDTGDDTWSWKGP